MKKITPLVVAVLVLFSNFLFAQTTITIRPPQGGLDDATISDNFPTSNFGSHPEELGLTWSCSSVPCVGRSLLNFDLSAIPASSIITSAQLYLYADINNGGNNGIPGQPTYGTDNSGWLRRITQSWNENTVTWSNQPAFTTQNEVILPQSTNTAQDYVADVTTLVQDMINNPGSSFGFLLMEQNETTYYNSLIFVSNDHADTAHVPMLVVTYTAGTMICTEIILDTEGEDATISDNFPTSNFPAHPEELALTWTCSSAPCVGRSLMKFDLGAIPSTAIIDSAFLKLYADINNGGNNGIPGQPTYGTDNAGWIRLITQSWSESSVTWSNQPSFTMLNEVVLPQSTNPTQDYVADVRNMVQDMVTNPGTGFGFLLMEQNEVNYFNSLIFCSGDYPDSTKFPVLKVCYTIPSGVSEISDGNDFVIFPNPATNEIRVQSRSFGTKFKVQRVEVYDVLGKLQISNFKLQTNSVDVSLLASGIYFVKVKGDKGERVAKFVKQ